MSDPFERPGRDRGAKRERDQRERARRRAIEDADDAEVLGVDARGEFDLDESHARSASAETKPDTETDTPPSEESQTPALSESEPVKAATEAEPVASEETADENSKVEQIELHTEEGRRRYKEAYLELAKTIREVKSAAGIDDWNNWQSDATENPGLKAQELFKLIRRTLVSIKDEYDTPEIEVTLGALVNYYEELGELHEQICADAEKYFGVATELVGTEGVRSEAEESVPVDKEDLSESVEGFECNLRTPEGRQEFREACDVLHVEVDEIVRRAGYENRQQAKKTLKGALPEQMLHGKLKKLLQNFPESDDSAIENRIERLTRAYEQLQNYRDQVAATAREQHGVDILPSGTELTNSHSENGDEIEESESGEPTEPAPREVRNIFVDHGRAESDSDTEPKPASGAPDPAPDGMPAPDPSIAELTRERLGFARGAEPTPEPATEPESADRAGEAPEADSPPEPTIADLSSERLGIDPLRLTPNMRIDDPENAEAAAAQAALVERYENRREQWKAERAAYKAIKQTYDEKLQAYYQEQANWPFYKKIKKVFSSSKQRYGLDPNLPEEIKILRSEYEAARQQYAKSLDEVLTTRGQAREENRKFSLEESPAKAAFARKFVLKPRQQMIEWQQAHLPKSETAKRLQAVQKFRNNNRRKLLVGRIVLAAAVGAATAGASGAVKGVRDVVAAMGGGVAGAWLFGKVGEYRTGRAKSEVQRRSGQFTLEDLNSFEKVLLDAVETADRRERQEKYYRIAGAMLGGVGFATVVSAYDTNGVAPGASNEEGQTSEATKEAVPRSGAESTIANEQAEEGAEVATVDTPAETPGSVEFDPVPPPAAEEAPATAPTETAPAPDGTETEPSAAPETERLTPDVTAAAGADELASATEADTLEHAAVPEVESVTPTVPDTTPIPEARPDGGSVSTSEIEAGTGLEAEPAIEHEIASGDSVWKLMERYGAEQLEGLSEAEQNRVLMQLRAEINGNEALQEAANIRSGNADLIYAGDTLHVDPLLETLQEKVAELKADSAAPESMSAVPPERPDAPYASEVPPERPVVSDIPPANVGEGQADVVYVDKDGFRWAHMPGVVGESGLPPIPPPNPVAEVGEGVASAEVAETPATVEQPVAYPDHYDFSPEPSDFETFYDKTFGKVLPDGAEEHYDILVNGVEAFMEDRPGRFAASVVLMNDEGYVGWRETTTQYDEVVKLTSGQVEQVGTLFERLRDIPGVAAVAKEMPMSDMFTIREFLDKLLERKLVAFDESRDLFVDPTNNQSLTKPIT